MSRDAARRHLRVLARTRGGYNGAVLHDVQLQVISSRRLLWAQTFTDRAQAERLHRDVQEDLADLDEAGFRQKYGLPASG